MPVHNRVHLLDRVLESLAANTTYPDVELLTVDDHSTDGSLDVLRRWEASGRAQALTVMENSGSGAIDALNTALNAATGELCAQLDDDVTVETPGWIERMVELMDVDDAVGVVTGKVVFDSGELHACGVNVVADSGWEARTRPAGGRVIRARRPFQEGEGGAIEQRVAEVDSGVGCFMMYRREDALSLGGYDPGWSPVWFDDVDLCLGIRRLGRKCFYLPEVRVVHYYDGRRPEKLRERLRPQRVARGAVRQIWRRVPFKIRDAVESRSDLDLFGRNTKEQRALLRHHHAYWRSKWGWDPRNPQAAEIQRRWGGTEICWATDPERRRAGERIVEAFELRRETVA